jgi:hypothetical protein
MPHLPSMQEQFGRVFLGTVTTVTPASNDVTSQLGLGHPRHCACALDLPKSAILSHRPASRTPFNNLPIRILYVRETVDVGHIAITHA